MTDNEERKLPGRPKKDIQDMSLSRQISFYWMNKHAKLWNLFESLCKKNSILKKTYPERCVSESMRTLIAQYVRHFADNDEDKQLANKFIEDEKERMSKIVNRAQELNKTRLDYKVEKKVSIKKVVKKPKKKIVEEPMSIHYCPDCPYDNKKEICLENQNDCIEAGRIIKPKWMEKE